MPLFLTTEVIITSLLKMKFVIIAEKLIKFLITKA